MATEPPSRSIEGSLRWRFSDELRLLRSVEEVENFAELSIENEHAEHHQDETGQRDMHSKEQQYVPRGGSCGMSDGGRRGYPNGRGGHGTGRGGGYQNGGGRHQYYDQGGNYYTRNSRWRGGAGVMGGTITIKAGRFNLGMLQQIPKPWWDLAVSFVILGRVLVGRGVLFIQRSIKNPLNS
ncbi:OLC1v1009140C1 [Oldenlandia corymbosa var. corymbosa]|uniref:OLC1v1009140C1 n=1 Tax=Oldenlandia corymbosa var. corymbosa TaxID=529605 RepID=A0AAV1DQL6_OLDCO|nr:OLC1v1009140C1 [Oldenlandia corymbosa var. corymbosa]